MTAEEFRTLALAMPGATEVGHMGHPDFRAGGKIFATLGPDESWGMVKLTPEQQAEYLRMAPKTFAPASGAWGRGGATLVTLKAASESVVREAIDLAWRNVTTKRPTKKRS
jgi:hypothetical protein